MAKTLKDIPNGGRIELVIGPDGGIRTRVVGVKGKGCEGLLDNLMDLFPMERHGRTEEYDVHEEVKA